MISVKVAKMGQQVKEYAMEGTSKVSDAVKLAGYSTSGVEIRKNNRACTLNDGLCNNDIITLVPSIKGGAY